MRQLQSTASPSADDQHKPKPRGENSPSGSCDQGCQQGDWGATSRESHPFLGSYRNMVHSGMRFGSLAIADTCPAVQMHRQCYTLNTTPPPPNVSP